MLNEAGRFAKSIGSAAGGSATSALVLVLLLGVGGYGACYGYCRYQLGEAIRGFDEAAGGQLHDWLRLRGRAVGPEDLRQFVEELAPRHHLTLEPGSLRVSVEPYSEASAAKLPAAMRAGLGLAGKAVRAGQGPALWVVGFRAELTGRYGLARSRLTAEHYTWFDSVRR